MRDLGRIAAHRLQHDSQTQVLYGLECLDPCLLDSNLDSFILDNYPLGM